MDLSSRTISQKCRREVKRSKQVYDSCYVLPNAFPNGLPRFGAPGNLGAGRWQVAPHPVVAADWPENRGRAPGRGVLERLQVWGDESSRPRAPRLGDRVAHVLARPRGCRGRLAYV